MILRSVPRPLRMDHSSLITRPSSPETALITGGAGDLAQAVASELQAHALDVLAPSRAELDVTSAASIAAQFEKITRLDLLVCCAGLIADTPFLKMEAADFAKVSDTNLTGAFRTARAALKLMAKQRSGHIIFIGSNSARSGPPGQSNYAAAKAGLIALTQSLAREYGSRNIRVNCILPGFLETKMTAHFTDEARAKFREANTLGRFNTAEHTARFVRFLHLEMPHTSGQVLSLDSRPNRWT